MDTPASHKEKQQRAGYTSTGLEKQPLLARIEKSTATQVARLIEPWLILLSAIGLAVLVTLLIMDRANRKLDLQKSEENRRQARISESWQVLTIKAPGNNGKNSALEYLNKQKINLAGIDLSTDQEQPATWLVDVNLNGADLSEANLSGANMLRADLGNATLVNTRFVSSDLSEANLKNVNLTDANLNGANLSRANLSNAILNRSDLTAAQLGSADLSGAILTDANLSEAYLIAADLSGADLRLAHLIGAEMIGANLSDANLSGAHMIGANLIGAVLNGACGDESTSYPEGFQALPVCEN